MFLFNWYFDCLIAHGVFGIVMKATYQSAAVFIKQTKSYSQHLSNVFRKEALALSQIKHENIIRLLGVCDDPVSIMTEYCYFSLRPFQRNEQFNSLDQQFNSLNNSIHWINCCFFYTVRIFFDNWKFHRQRYCISSFESP